MIAMIGGGITSLSIGWLLAKAGQPVTIFERDETGRGATWAAAGMLTPWVSPDDPAASPTFNLQMDSLALWPNFARQLEAATNIPLDYRADGRLFVVLDHEDVAGLEHHYEFNQQLGLSLEWQTGDQARKLEPHLPSSVTNAVFAPTVCCVDNRQVALALRQAFLQAGGTLREKTAVQGVWVDQNRVRGVRLANETVSAETVVLAAGAWSNQISDLPETVQLAVRPVKGQMLALQMPPDAPLVNRMVTGPVILIPRSDGRLLVGATIEEQGFDTHVTAGAIWDMLSCARQMLPAIDRLPLIETWAGLRPASADNLPVLGPTGISGLVIATGHFRHGILLAPITAQAISHYIQTGQVMDVIKPFAPTRFNN